MRFLTLGFSIKLLLLNALEVTLKIIDIYFRGDIRIQNENPA